MTAVPVMFRKSDQIGAAGAEDDTEYLATCFVDTGDLLLLEDSSDHRVVVLGRTGSGKTALLQRLRRRHPDTTITVDPESLALAYVSNSTVLSYFSSLGVNLDPFFKLLWRHVLTVEILTKHFATADIPKEETWLAWLKRRFGGSSKSERELREAIEYLEKWGARFWNETEYRVQEITRQIEGELSNEFRLAIGTPIAEAGIGGAAKIHVSEEQKGELIRRGQDVVVRHQVQDLGRVVKLLDSVLADRQRRYYVLIDKLDSNWVDDRLRYKLIMALIDTAREFIGVDNAKVILALRLDLVERVFRVARASGFQEEKYRSLYLPLEWSCAQLIELLDKRIDALVRQRYTKQKVTHAMLLPKKINGVDSSDHLCTIARRPRDMIAFFNVYISAVNSTGDFTVDAFTIAEGEYSRDRMKALADEWQNDYPNLPIFAAVFRKRPATMSVVDIDRAAIDEACLAVLTNDSPTGALESAAHRFFFNDTLTFEQFRLQLVETFYRVGFVGLKMQTFETVSWADERGRGVTTAEIVDSTRVVVHPAYRRALGCT